MAQTQIHGKKNKDTRDIEENFACRSKKGAIWKLKITHFKPPVSSAQIDTFKRQMPTAMSKLAPEPIPDGFEWKNDRIHLTYKGFLPMDDLLAMVRRATSTPMKGYSIVHEDTSEDTHDGVMLGYEHTHLAVMFKAPLRLKGSRIFDFYVEDFTGLPVAVHPNAQIKLTMVSFEVLFMYYHAGRKYDITTGKTIYKAPVARKFYLPPDFDFGRAIMAEMVVAPNLFEACVAGEIRPRTVNDVKSLRDDCAAQSNKRFKHIFDPSTFKDLAPFDWSVLHVWGGSGLGKTKWAVAQFRNPCLVKPFDSVGCLESLAKSFDPKVHDGLVLDEADLNFMTRTQVIAFFDQDEECTLDVRYKSFTLPAGLRKIVVSNPSPESLYPADPYGAIARRREVVHVTVKTWKQPLANITNATPNTATPPTIVPALDLAAALSPIVGFSP